MSEILLAALCISLAGWIPVGSEAVMRLAQAIAAEPWFTPCCGSVQLAMGISGLLYFRKQFRKNALSLTITSIPLFFLGYWVQSFVIPDFITGVVTITVGVLYVIQTVTKPVPPQTDSLLRLFIIMISGCFGVIPGAGILSMVMLAFILTGSDYHESWRHALLFLIPILLLGGCQKCMIIPSLQWEGILICILGLAGGFVATPVILRMTGSWFHRHSPLIFGLWRIVYGLIFLLVFCVF